MGNFAGGQNIGASDRNNQNVAKGQTHLNPIARAIAGQYEFSGVLNLGNWQLNVFAERRGDIETLGTLVRQPIARQSTVPQPDALLYLLTAPAGGELFPHPDGEPPAQNADWETVGDTVRMLYTGWFRIWVDDAPPLPRIVIFCAPAPRYQRSRFFATICSKSCLRYYSCMTVFIYTRRQSNSIIKSICLYRFERQDDDFCKIGASGRNHSLGRPCCHSPRCARHVLGQRFARHDARDRQD